MKDPFKRLVGIALASWLAGCSSNVHVEKVPEVSPYMPAEGIYYSLPKTRLVFRNRLTQKMVVTGRLHTDFETHLAECRSLGTDATLSVPALEPESKFKLGAWEILARTVADPKHRYLVEVEPETFSAFTHTIALNEDGVLPTADSTVKNVALEVALAVSETLLDTLSHAAFAPQVSPDKAREEARVPCVAVLAVGDFLPRQRAIDDAREAYILQVAPKVDPRNVEKALSVFAARERRLLEEFAKKAPDFEKTLAMTNKAKKEIAYILEGPVEPREFTAADDLAPDWTLRKAPKKPGQGEAPPTTTKSLEEIPADLAATLAAFRVGVVMDHAKSLNCGNSDGGCGTEPEGDGFRYRLPIDATVEMKQCSTDGGTTTCTVQARARTKIAQFGPIASLPSSFGGASGNIHLATYSHLGTAKKITVGAEAVPAETVQGFGSAISETLKAREDARAAEKAKEKTAENDRLTEERDLLQLKRRSAT